MSTQLTIYSGPQCHRCEQTIRLFKEQNIEPRIVDVHEDQTALEHMKMLGFSALPVVLPPQGEPWSGFNLMKIRQTIQTLVA